MDLPIIVGGKYVLAGFTKSNASFNGKVVVIISAKEGKFKVLLDGDASTKQYSVKAENLVRRSPKTAAITICPYVALAFYGRCACQASLCPRRYPCVPRRKKWACTRAR